ncbi:hypothetical protein CMO91_01320 [Candidatus Woesearchaeota archaeon]|jgi:hypothetical protein|nr:hypothetical protein [Candidatus Woesearchaeota archaeon]|tara:strand:- start:63 stop:509 length:447 start_codon:yes stop_codon:yes gene_type:complete
MQDLCFPGKEEDFLAIAERLDLKLTFVYKKLPQKEGNIMALSDLSFLDSRKALKKDSLVHGLFETEVKLNQVVCKIAAKNGCTFLLPFAPLLRMTLPQRAERLAKWAFALRLFKKYKVHYRVVSFAKDPSELRSKLQLDAVVASLRQR